MDRIDLSQRLEISTVAPFHFPPVGNVKNMDGDFVQSLFAFKSHWAWSALGWLAIFLLFFFFFFLVMQQPILAKRKMAADIL